MRISVLVVRLIVVCVMFVSSFDECVDYVVVVLMVSSSRLIVRLMVRV